MYTYMGGERGGGGEVCVGDPGAGRRGRPIWAFRGRIGGEGAEREGGSREGVYRGRTSQVEKHERFELTALSYTGLSSCEVCKVVILRIVILVVYMHSSGFYLIKVCTLFKIEAVPRVSTMSSLTHIYTRTRTHTHTHTHTHAHTHIYIYICTHDNILSKVRIYVCF